MNAREKGLELIERYVYHVGDELPAAQRDDVKAELRSLLTEQLEERIAGAEAPENAAVELLQSFGKPDDVAIRYGPQGQYLIGPQVYPYFLFFAKINFYIILGMFAFWSFFGMVTGNTRLPEFLRPGSLIAWFMELGQLLAVNMAIMVIVFAMIDRHVRTQPQEPKKAAKWDPRDLAEVPPATAAPDKISEPGLIGKIYAIVALAVMLNFYPRYFGILIFRDHETLAIPYTALGIFLPVTLMNVWWAGALALNVWLLTLRRWTLEARWVQLALNVVGAGILFIVITASSFSFEPEYLAGHGSALPERLVRGIERTLPFGGGILKLALICMLVASVIEGLMRLWRILRRDSSAPGAAYKSSS